MPRTLLQAAADSVCRITGHKIIVENSLSSVANIDQKVKKSYSYSSNEGQR